METYRKNNMARLSRENRIIELQMRVDLEGLDETADAQQILQRRTEALTRQIKNQRQRVELASAELRNMTQSTGENSDQTQRAQLQFEHERLALARLEEQLNSLNETQDDANEGRTKDLLRQIKFAGGDIIRVDRGLSSASVPSIRLAWLTLRAYLFRRHINFFTC